MATDGVQIEIFVDDEAWIRIMAKAYQALNEVFPNPNLEKSMLEMDAIIYRRVVRRGVAALMEQDLWQ